MTSGKIKEFIQSIHDLCKQSVDESAPLLFSLDDCNNCLEQTRLLLQELNSSKIQSSPDSVHVTAADLIGLPDELLKELNITESDRKDFFVLRIIEDLGGTASLDKILIEIYRRTSEVEKRSKLVARLYRLIQRKQLFNGKLKGVYTIKSPVSDE